MSDYYFSDETDQVVCEICGGTSGVGIRRVMCDDFCCQHCLYVWYEGAGIDSEAVRAASLRRQAILAATEVPKP